MISILTNEGALEFARTLSGDSYFLAYKCALLGEGFGSMQTAAALGAADVILSGETGGKIGIMDIRHTFDCTGSLPVQVSGETIRDSEPVAYESMAVDFDFNGQAPVNKETGIPIEIEYRTVVALGLRFRQYPQVTKGETYKKGDHVWNGPLRDKVYICVAETVEYGGESLVDNPDWVVTDGSDMKLHPSKDNYYADPASDTIPFFVTSYDDPVTISNGMEWEYKVRVFLDNLLTDQLPSLENQFSIGGLEGAGSLLMSFLAGISGALRENRDLSSTIIL